MIREQYRVPGVVKARYVRRHLCQDWYVWCEQSAADPRYDVAQGTCDAEDLPDDVREKCDRYTGHSYAAEWPMEVLGDG